MHDTFADRTLRDLGQVQSRAEILARAGDDHGARVAGQVDEGRVQLGYQLVIGGVAFGGAMTEKGKG